MTKVEFGKAAPVAAPMIALLLVGLFGISYIISVILNLPSSLGLPLVLRTFGGVLAIAGVAVAGWTFSYRRPADMMVSTYVTLTKLIWRRPISEPLGRTEPLVVAGAQKYVRNPLYLGVITITLGWGLVTGYPFVLVAAVVLFVWCRFFLIPFEENELLAIFGDEYARYRDDVPMLVPFTKMKKRVKPSGP